MALLPFQYLIILEKLWYVYDGMPHLNLFKPEQLYCKFSYSNHYFKLTAHQSFKSNGKMK